MSAEIVYEVNLSVEPDAAGEYERWLATHIEEMLAIEGFLGAEWHERLEPPSENREYVVLYRLRDRTALERYLLLHADRMRRDGTERFGGRFTATRRVLEVRRSNDERRTSGNDERRTSSVERRSRNDES